MGSASVKRTVGVVTTSRADYGIYLPVLRRMSKDSLLEPYLMVTGMHLSPEFGVTAEMILEDGFEIGERIESLLSSDTPEGIAKSMGLTTIGFAQAFSRSRPDFLLVLGDRFEMHAAVVAASPFRVPIAHIAGGETTIGSVDECYRHSISKFAHLHFVSADAYGERLVRMGEEPWRVRVTGTPSIDGLLETRLPSIEEMNNRLSMDVSAPFLLVTYHPETQSPEGLTAGVRAMLDALDASGYPLLVTSPNADAGGRRLLALLREFEQARAHVRLVPNLGPQLYAGVMSRASAMVGNSSSGIVEAGTFRLPVVNIGNRQRGRLRGPNVIDADHDREQILLAIQEACSDRFRNNIYDMKNPFGDGRAGEKIIDVLESVSIDRGLLIKEFHEGSAD